MMSNAKYIAAKAALEFYTDHGVDIAVDEDVTDKTALSFAAPANAAPVKSVENANTHTNTAKAGTAKPPAPATPAPLLGKTDAHAKAVEFAKAAKTLENLKEAIAQFDGIGLKKTATNLVFAGGNPNAKIMIIGEAPGADEDRQGKAFVGNTGDLLNKILACIDLDRESEDPLTSVYISNILNWRPPGNRTPSPAEIEVSLPFIERHIQLVNPQLLILCGGVSAKALLGSGDSISRLRKKWHNYMPQNASLAKDAKPIPAIATYHPTYLLRTPTQKRAVWQDMLMLNEKRKELNLLP